MAHVAATEVVVAAHTLVLAGQWDTAAKLLDGATYDDAAEAASLAYAAAEVEVERAWWDGTPPNPAVVARATGWDADLLVVRMDQRDALFAPGGRDKSAGPALAERAAWLYDTAPDPLRAGRAAFWHGVIRDVLCDDQPTAERRYAEAVVAADAAGNDVLAGFALRHIGFHFARDGNGGAALEYSRLAIQRRAGAGFVTGLLAQRLMHAELLSGTHSEIAAIAEPATARAILDEVRLEALALRGGWVATEAAELLTKLTPAEDLA